MMTLSVLGLPPQPTTNNPHKSTASSTTIPATCFSQEWEDDFLRSSDLSLYSSGEESEPPSPQGCPLHHSATSTHLPEAHVVAVVSPPDDNFELVDLGPDNVENFFRCQFSDDETEQSRKTKTSSPDKEAPTENTADRAGPRPSAPKKRSPTKSCNTPVSRKEDVAGPQSPTGTGGGRKLWEFLLSLLCDTRHNPSLVKWLDAKEGVFTFTNSRAAACLWGQRRGHSEMSYEHMSRAIRHYYKSQVILRVPGRRLVYKFGPKARGWWQRVEKSKILQKMDIQPETASKPKAQKRSSKLCPKPKVSKEPIEPTEPTQEAASESLVELPTPVPMEDESCNIPETLTYLDQPMDMELCDQREEIQLKVSVEVVTNTLSTEDVGFKGVLNDIMDAFPCFGRAPGSQGSVPPELSDILADATQLL